MDKPNGTIAINNENTGLTPGDVLRLSPDLLPQTFDDTPYLYGYVTQLHYHTGKRDDIASVTINLILPKDRAERAPFACVELPRQHMEGLGSASYAVIVQPLTFRTIDKLFTTGSSDTAYRVGSYANDPVNRPILQVNRQVDLDDNAIPLFTQSKLFENIASPVASAVERGVKDDDRGTVHRGKQKVKAKAVDEGYYMDMTLPDAQDILGLDAAFVDMLINPLDKKLPSIQTMREFIRMQDEIPGFATRYIPPKPVKGVDAPLESIVFDHPFNPDATTWALSHPKEPKRKSDAPASRVTTLAKAFRLVEADPRELLKYTGMSEKNYEAHAAAIRKAYTELLASQGDTSHDTKAADKSKDLKEKWAQVGSDVQNGITDQKGGLYDREGLQPILIFIPRRAFEKRLKSLISQYKGLKNDGTDLRPQ